MEQTKKFNIDIDYKVVIPAEMKDNKSNQKLPSFPEMTDNFIKHSVYSVYLDPQDPKKGLTGPQRRAWGRIQRKLASALESKNYVLELETKEVDFLKTSFAQSKCPPDVSMYYIILEDEINKL